MAASPFGITKTTVNAPSRPMSQQWMPISAGKRQNHKEFIFYEDTALEDESEEIRALVQRFGTLSSSLDWSDPSFPDECENVDPIIAESIIVRCCLPEQIHTILDAIKVFERLPRAKMPAMEHAHHAFDVIHYLARAYYPHSFPLEKIDVEVVRFELERLSMRGRALMFFCDDPHLCFDDPADATMARILLRKPLDAE